MPERGGRGAGWEGGAGREVPWNTSGCATLSAVVVAVVRARSHEPARGGQLDYS